MTMDLAQAVATQLANIEKRTGKSLAFGPIDQSMLVQKIKLLLRSHCLGFADTNQVGQDSLR
jgi:hypothetical protein